MNLALPNLAELRERLSYQGLSLGATALITGALLAGASQLTKPSIQAAEARDLQASLAQVLPGGFDNDLLADTLTLPSPEGGLTVYRARKGGALSGVVFKVTGYGYAGAIVCLLGLDPGGHILGVRVLKHAETPGLGDRIEPGKSDWIQRFDGKSLGDPPAERWGVKKDGGDFDQFTGATITPRGVVKAITEGLEFFARERDRILAAPPATTVANATPQ